MIEIAHQRRTRQLACHFLGWTAHVDVDLFRALGFGDACALRHPFSFTAGELDDEGREIATLGAADDVGAVTHQLFTGDHFGDHDRRAQAVGKASERQVGDAGHRRERDQPGGMARGL